MPYSCSIRSVMILQLYMMSLSNSHRGASDLLEANFTQQSRRIVTNKPMQHFSTYRTNSEQSKSIRSETDEIA